MLLPDVTGWSADAIEAILTDLSLWEKPVRQIAAQAGIPSGDIVPGYPASSAVFILNQNFVLKIFTPLFHKKREVESEVLSALAHIDAVPSPKILSKGVFYDKIAWPYLIIEYIPGTALRELLPRMDTETLSDMAVQLGSVVRSIHQTDTTSLEKSLATQGDAADSLADLGQGAAAALQRLATLDASERAYLSNRTIAELESLFSSIPLGAPLRPMVLVNLDLTEDHLFLTQQQGLWLISGLIDFADSAIGPPELDWHDLRFCMFANNAPAMGAFWHAYDPQLVVDAAYCRKCMLYTLANHHWFETVKFTLNKHGRTSLDSLDELQEILWPSSLWT